MIKSYVKIPIKNKEEGIDIVHRDCMTIKDMQPVAWAYLPEFL